jgi:hypothetical protein
VVVFAPNRLYPFETHGFYLGDKHVFKLLPFINYFPDPVRDHFCPHVRVYSKGCMRRLFKGLPVEIDVHTQVFPAFDGVARSKPVVALALRRFLYAAEETPLCAFGLSHFVVARKSR